MSIQTVTKNLINTLRQVSPKWGHFYMALLVVIFAVWPGGVI
jgi:hypothetical protein